MSFVIDTYVRVRYAETDKMGYVYYGNYATYLEVARTEWIRNLGISYREIEEDWKIMLPVHSLHIDYKNPAFYDDLLHITTKVSEPKGVRLEFFHEIFNEKSVKIIEAKVVLVFVDAGTMKPCRIPYQFLTQYYAQIS